MFKEHNKQLIRLEYKEHQTTFRELTLATGLKRSTRVTQETQRKKMSLTILTQVPGFSGEYEKQVLVPCMEEFTINVMGERITLWIPEESTSVPHLDEFLEDCVRPRPGNLLWDLCDAVGFFKAQGFTPLVPANPERAYPHQFFFRL